MIKRFKEILEGDLSHFETAVTLSPEDFEMNEAKTHLRYVRKEEDKKEEKIEESKEDKRNAQKKEVILSHFESQNKRSIYSVSKK
jgi:hypothetical protein